VSKKVFVSVDLLKRLLKQAGLENKRVKLGRWVIKRELGEVVGRESKVES
jgi:hypothetical protein